MTVNSRDRSTRLLVITAMLTALTTIATLFFKIPLAVGYIHLGDAMVFIAAMTLPRKHALFAGSIGCALADVVGGYAVWAPWTLVAKALMVIVVYQAYKIVQSINARSIAASSVDDGKSGGYDDCTSGASVPKSHGTKTSLILIVAFVISAALNIAVYYVAEGAIYGNWVAPVAGIPTNAVQSGVGVVLALAIRKMIPKNII